MRLPYDLPVAEVYPLHLWCQDCGEHYHFKIRLTAPAPFAVFYFCGREIQVDPKALILLPED